MDPAAQAEIYNNRTLVIATVGLVIAAVGLAVALVGGVPGILAIVQYFRERTKLVFHWEHLIRGYLPQADGTVRATILLSGMVTNPGSEPLYPKSYEAFCRVGSRWIQLERALIPPGTTFQSEEQEIKVTDAEKHDLQRDTRALLKGDPQFGHLMFMVPDSAREQLFSESPSRMKLVCEDTLGKKRTAEFLIQKGTMTGATVFPHVGVEVRTKGE